MLDLRSILKKDSPSLFPILAVHKDVSVVIGNRRMVVAVEKLFRGASFMALAQGWKVQAWARLVRQPLSFKSVAFAGSIEVLVHSPSLSLRENHDWCSVDVGAHVVVACRWLQLLPDAGFHAPLELLAHAVQGGRRGSSAFSKSAIRG